MIRPRFLNGNVVWTQILLYFMVMMYLSISGTRQYSETGLNVIFISAATIWIRSETKYPSTKSVYVWNNILFYILLKSAKLCINALVFCVDTNLCSPKLYVSVDCKK